MFISGTYKQFWSFPTVPLPVDLIVPSAVEMGDEYGC